MFRIKEYYANFNMKICDEQIDKMQRYMEGILEWNKKVNLTSIVKKDDFIYKHLIDSILGSLQEEMLQAEKIIDVGTGGGFPGIPLAIMFPEKQFFLMDSLKKRLNIIEELCEELDIKNVTTVHARVEDMGNDATYRENFDVGISRAVANLSTLSEYVLPLIKIQGTFVAYKGPEAQKELLEANRAIRILGGEVSHIKQYKYEENTRNIILIDKVKKTPKKYPRRAGMPKKQPL